MIECERGILRGLLATIVKVALTPGDWHGWPIGLMPSPRVGWPAVEEFDNIAELVNRLVEYALAFFPGSQFRFTDHTARSVGAGP